MFAIKVSLHVGDTILQCDGEDMTFATEEAAQYEIDYGARMGFAAADDCKIVPYQNQAAA